MFLLALYIVVDFATPLLPGAFRFDMSQSIEAGGRPGVRVAVSIVHGALPADRGPVVSHDPEPIPGLVRRPNGAAPRVRDVPRPARADRPPDPLEDH